jgi:TetR/AcrR family transcriptional regulator of autoinduction and epiphytic fitness
LREQRRPPGRPRRSDLVVPAREAILAAAATLFMDRGYRSVTMEMVAAEAGVTKAAVYYHFADKASLLVEAVKAIFAHARSATQAILDRPESLRLRLEAIALAVLRFPQPFTHYEAMLHEATPELSSEQLAEVRRHEREVVVLLERAVADATARGEIRAAAPRLLAHAFVALLRVGQARDEAGQRLFPDEAVTAKAVVALWWDGAGEPPETRTGGGW